MKSVVAAVVLCGAMSLAAAIAADQLAEKWEKRIRDAEASYAAAVMKADNARFYAVQKANGDRLTILKKVLSDATKAGDFDAATMLKEKVAVAELDGIGRAKPKNVIKFGGHEYALVDAKVTWHVAKKRCEEMGGHLVTFDAAGEQEFCLAACRNAKLPAWIGVSNAEDISQFKWVSGTAAVKDPSWQFDDGSEKDFAVAVAYWPPSGTFNDHNLGAVIGYVCEWDR